MTLEKRVSVHDVRRTGKKDRVRRFIWTDETYDDYKTVLLSDGWDFSRFRLNPQIHWAHLSMMPPIGNAEDHGEETFTRELRGKKVEAVRRWVDVRFASKRSSEFADTILKLVDEGMLRATSAGFNPIETRKATDDERTRFGIPDEDSDNAQVFARNKLFEISVVSLPGNENAVKEIQAIATRVFPGATWIKEARSGLTIPDYCHELLRRIACRMEGIDEKTLDFDPGTWTIKIHTKEELDELSKTFAGSLLLNKQTIAVLDSRQEEEPEEKPEDKPDEKPPEEKPTNPGGRDEQIMKAKAIAKAATGLAEYIEENVPEEADVDESEGDEQVADEVVPGDDVGEGQEKSIEDLVSDDAGAIFIDHKGTSWNISEAAIETFSKILERAIDKAFAKHLNDKTQMTSPTGERSGEGSQTDDSYLDGLADDNLESEVSLSSILNNMEEKK